MNTTPERSAWRAGIPALLAALLPPVAGCMMDSAAIAPPTISQAPVAPAVAHGSTLTLAVRASGTGQLAYQWQRDGVPIAGARAPQHTIRQLGAVDDRAQYRVLVSNAGGVASSVPVVLHVMSAAAQDVQPARAAQPAGTSR